MSAKERLAAAPLALTQSRRRRYPLNTQAVAQLLWGDAAHTAAVQAQWAEPFDLVVGSDLLRCTVRRPPEYCRARLQHFLRARLAGSGQLDTPRRRAQATGWPAAFHCRLTTFLLGSMTRTITRRCSTVESGPWQRPAPAPGARSGCVSALGAWSGSVPQLWVARHSRGERSAHWPPTAFLLSFY